MACTIPYNHEEMGQGGIPLKQKIFHARPVLNETMIIYSELQSSFYE